MPIFMCKQLAMMNNSMMIAMTGEPRICAAPAWLLPSIIMTTTITGTIKSTIATAVRRWRQKSEVPECEAPRLRTRESGVRIDVAAADLVEDLAEEFCPLLG